MLQYAFKLQLIRQKSTEKMIKLVHFLGFVHRTLHGGVTEQSATTDDERRDLYMKVRLFKNKVLLLLLPPPHPLIMPGVRGQAPKNSLSEPKVYHFWPATFYFYFQF